MKGRCDIKSLLLLVLGHLTIQGEVGADQSWLGTEFVFNIPSPWDIDFKYEHNATVLISTPSVPKVYVEISVPGLGFKANATVTRHQHAEVSLPRHTKLNGTGIQNKTVFVRSDRVVSVHAMISASAMDGFLVLPVDKLGTTYYIASYYDEGRDTFPSEFSVTAAIKKDTNLTISPTNGDPFVMVLKAYDTYQYQVRADVTGTKIESSEPIAVIAGSICPYIPSATCCCDSIVEQMVPTESWSVSAIFHLAPFLGLTSGFTYRVVTNGTARITVRSNVMDSDNDIGLFKSVRLNAGETFEHSVVRRNKTNDPTSEVVTISVEQEIAGDGPVTLVKTLQPVSGMLVQYMNGAYLDNRLMGDPSMLIVPPVEKYAHNVTFPVFNPNFDRPLSTVWRNYTYYINVYINCSYMEGLTFDDNITMSNWDRLSSHDGSMCVIRSNVTNGTHTVGHPDEEAKFTVSVYSYSQDDSYAYPAGFSLRQHRKRHDAKEKWPMWIGIGAGGFVILVFFIIVISYTVWRQVTKGREDQTPMISNIIY